MTTTDKDMENFLPGMKPVLELLEREPEKVDMVYVRKGRASAESSRLLDLCREYGVRFSLVNDDTLSRMAAHAGHQGVIARLRDAAFTPWETFLEQAAHAPLPLMVALDQVQDPGNVGTLARTLFAMGGAGLILPKHNSAFLGPGARRSAAGALERLPITQVVNLSRAVKEAREAGFVTCAAQKVDNSVNPLTEKLPLPRPAGARQRRQGRAPRRAQALRMQPVHPLPARVRLPQRGAGRSHSHFLLRSLAGALTPARPFGQACGRVPPSIGMFSARPRPAGSQTVPSMPGSGGSAAVRLRQNPRAREVPFVSRIERPGKRPRRRPVFPKHQTPPGHIVRTAFFSFVSRSGSPADRRAPAQPYIFTGRGPKFPCPRG